MAAATEAKGVPASPTNSSVLCKDDPDKTSSSNSKPLNAVSCDGNGDDSIASLVEEEGGTPKARNHREQTAKGADPDVFEFEEGAFEDTEDAIENAARLFKRAGSSNLSSSATSECGSIEVRSAQQDSRRYSYIAQSAKIAVKKKYERIVASSAKLGEAEKNKRMRDVFRSSISSGLSSGSEPVKPGTNTDAPAIPGGVRSAFSGSLSLDEDVANVDKLLFQTAYYVIATWLGLICFSYWAAPRESIQWLTGTERNACLVELSILATAATMKHGPLLWEINFMDFPQNKGTGQNGWINMMGTPRVSGILVGGLVVQCIAIMTATIMIAFPVPVMIDPVFGSRVHLIRWCEWTPLAAFMTLMTECIDAPVYDGSRLTHDWKAKFTVAAHEGVSTLCGLIFPFCPNLIVWSLVMLFSCVTYSSIIFRYFEKKKAFKLASRGSSVDEIELYNRSRMSLALQGMCCLIWSGITVMYFVSNGGHLIVPKSWTIFHDSAATMVEECFMDLVAKILYMALIIEAHYAAFDEAKRANRRLAELKNTMSVVWENSSDTISISVRKMSGSVTSMVSPSFFRPALVARQQENIEEISAIVLELAGLEIKKRRDSFTSSTGKIDSNLPKVGIRVVHKADFAGIDLHSSPSDDVFDGIIHTGGSLDAMSLRVLAFTDMLSRAWQSNRDELVFEHDAVLQDGGTRTKFEVKVTRLEENAIVVVVRDVSERYRRFEAEKRFVFETTARQKDAEANRFTRHEVKNGLLAAIEICGNVREQFSEDFNLLQKDGQLSSNFLVSETNLNSRVENISELDRTLHEVLDIVLAETMARDVIHELYVPKMERVDVNYIMSHMRGFKACSNQFSLSCSPSPLPILQSDLGLFKCIHGNAIRNALKYGGKGGRIMTEAAYSADTGEFEMKIINMPGPGHHELVAMGSRARELVFAHGTRLHKDSDLGQRSHSAGDGAWIMHKCAKILGGSVEISFEETRTVFVFIAPCKVFDAPTREIEHFSLPPGVWGIGIDDSKIQRKLLRRFFIHAGILENHQIILGQNTDEISTFVDFVVDFVKRHPGDLFFIIADENLELGDDITNHETISGSECIQRIRITLDPEQENRMLALVRSANDSPQDLAIYTSRAHGYMPKVPLQGMSVREMVSPLWGKRFPQEKKEFRLNDGEGSDSDNELSRIPSIENLRDLTLISPAEILSELEQIDALCVSKGDTNLNNCWPVLWEKLHQLKGDLKTVNVDDKFTQTINAIEAMRGENPPPDLMTKWLHIRTKVVLFDGTK